MKRTLAALLIGLGVSSPAAAQEVKLAWEDHPTLRAGKWLRIFSALAGCRLTMANAA